MRIKKFFSFIVTLIVIAFLIWLVISWIDINQHNNPFSNDYLNYAKWNLFEIFHKVKELIRFWKRTLPKEDLNVQNAVLLRLLIKVLIIEQNKVIKKIYIVLFVKTRIILLNCQNMSNKRELNLFYYVVPPVY